MSIEDTIRQILQDNRIHFKNRMAMEDVATALINGLQSFAAKPAPEQNLSSPATYGIPAKTPLFKNEWSPQDVKLLKDNNPGV
jgi:hypothetical protein